MADDTQGATTETPAQRLIRERQEKDLAAKDNQHTDAGASGEKREENKTITAEAERGATQDESATSDATGLTKEQEKHLEIDGEPRQGHAPLPRMNNVITGRHIGREENPSDLLKTDGSKSPHDVTSGGSRQAEGIRQAEAALQAAREAADSERRRSSGTGAVQTPTEEQRASGAVAAEQGRAG